MIISKKCRPYMQLWFMSSVLCLQSVYAKQGKAEPNTNSDKVITTKEVASDFTVQTLRYREALLLVWTPQPAASAGVREFRVIITGAEKVLLQNSFTGRQALAGVEVSLAGIKTGDYHLTITQIEKDGTANTIIDRPLRYTIPDRSVIDINANNVMLVHGKPFFPLGIYHVRAADFAIVAAHDFNIVIADNSDPIYYSPRQRTDYINAAGKLGMMTLANGYSWLLPLYTDTKKPVWGAVQDYVKDPKVIGWYVDDEPATTVDVQLQDIQRYENGVRKDPTHPMYILDNKPENFDKSSMAGDIVCSDPYTFSQVPLTAVSDWTNKLRHAVHDQKPVWTTLQMYTYTSNDPNKPGWNDLPMPAKLRAESYLSLASGARGLMYYSFDDTYYKTPAMRGVNLAKEFSWYWDQYNTVIHELYSRANIWTSPYAKAVITNLDKSTFVASNAYLCDNALWILAINPSRTAASTVSFSVGAHFDSVKDDLNKASSAQLKDGKVTGSLPALGVALYKITLKN